jgi:two-component system sensor histidine kinase MtrB
VDSSDDRGAGTAPDAPVPGAAPGATPDVESGRHGHHGIRRRINRPALPFSRGRGNGFRHGNGGHGSHDPRTVPRGEMGPGSAREAVRLLFRRPVTFLDRAWELLRQRWRTSIQMRVIGSVFLSSLLVLLALGFVLTSFVTQQLLDSKHDTAVDEIDRARSVVETQFRNSDTSNPLPLRIGAARAALTDRTSGAGDTTAGNGTVYQAVLIAPDLAGNDVASPEGIPIPDNLRRFVQHGQVTTEYTTVRESDGAHKALVVGSPVSSDIRGVELYLVMPLDNEESALGLMRGLLSAGGLVLLVLLVVIAWVFSQQLTVPVRTASRIAERFAAGHLRERMAVDGEDEVARLAISFNEMAESLSHQIRQLEDFGSLQQQFTSDVSHELRTPLTTVRMASDLIHDNAEDLDPVTRRASELMNAELDRFEMLLGDLLEISRHDAGVANLSLEKVDVRGVVRSPLEQVRAIAEDVGCDIELDLPDEPVMVQVDSRRVERILRNLLANAVDHSEGRPVRVAMRTGGGSLAVSVVDHGMGLKPGESDLVFNRFWRSDPSRERRTGGTGLGLAIAKEDAQLHGGRLEATGEPGLGACFRLTLPLEPGDEVRTSPLPLEIDRADPALAPDDSGDTGDTADTAGTSGAAGAAGPEDAEHVDAADGTEATGDTAPDAGTVDDAAPGVAVAHPAEVEQADTVFGASDRDAGDSVGGVVDQRDSVDVTAGSAVTDNSFGVDISAFEGLTEDELRIALKEAADMDSGAVDDTVDTVDTADTIDTDNADEEVRGEDRDEN